MTEAEARRRLSEWRAEVLKSGQDHEISNAFVSVHIQAQRDDSGRPVRVVYRVNGRQQTLAMTVEALVRGGSKPEGPQT